jgi:hypothetical protein
MRVDAWFICPGRPEIDTLEPGYNDVGRILSSKAFHEALGVWVTSEALTAALDM